MQDDIAHTLIDFKDIDQTDIDAAIERTEDEDGMTLPRSYVASMLGKSLGSIGIPICPECGQTQGLWHFRHCSQEGFFIPPIPRQSPEPYVDPLDARTTV